MKRGFGFFWWGLLFLLFIEPMACFPTLPPDVEREDAAADGVQHVEDTLEVGDVEIDVAESVGGPDNRDGTVDTVSCGTEFECDDGLACTSDQCIPSGECAHTLLTGFCLIGEACLQTGFRNPENRCEVCGEGNAWTTLTPLNCSPVCGDGLVTGVEGCDDGASRSGDGCDSFCQAETGYECIREPSVCRTRCGDAIRAGDEGCDDGNTAAGDGCDAHCKAEPGYACGTNGCQPICGDGWRMQGEDCDDGNVQAGDGCNPFCQVESGWTCRELAWGDGTLLLPLQIFDFKAQDEVGGHPDFQAYLSHQFQTGLVEPTLGDDHVPIFVHRGVPPVLTSAQDFQQWYHHVPGINQDFKLSLDMSPTNGGNTYVYDRQEFFPIDGMGFGEYKTFGHNYHFTSVTRWRFVYRGGERVSFTGDDDVWIFVNRRLAIDLGGTHLPATGSVQFPNSTDPTTGQRRDERFELFEGGIYEVAVFHAERYISQSTFRLEIEMNELKGNTSRCMRQ